jgi:hypothetical protein
MRILELSSGVERNCILIIQKERASFVARRSGDFERIIGLRFLGA